MRNHVFNTFTKLQVADRAHAIIVPVRPGWEEKGRRDRLSQTSTPPAAASTLFPAPVHAQAVD